MRLLESDIGNAWFTKASSVLLLFSISKASQMLQLTVTNRSNAPSPEQSSPLRSARLVVSDWLVVRQVHASLQPCFQGYFNAGPTWALLQSVITCKCQDILSLKRRLIFLPHSQHFEPLLKSISLLKHGSNVVLFILPLTCLMLPSRNTPTQGNQQKKKKRKEKAYI